MKRFALAVLALLPLAAVACRSPQAAEAPRDYDGARSRAQESQKSLDSEIDKSGGYK